MVIRPVVSSIRSKHTGQVGSSTRSAVGGGNGLRELDTDDDGSDKRGTGFVGVSTVMDLMYVT